MLMTGRALWAVVALVSACSTGRLRTDGPYPREHAPTEGLRYYVGRDMLVAVARVDERIERNWVMPPIDAHLLDKPCSVGLQTTRWINATLTLTPTATADRRFIYRMATTPSRSTSQVFGMKVSEDGLLTGLNHESHDQRAEIMGAVLKSVAGIAGVALGLPSTWSPAELAALDTMPIGAMKIAGDVNPAKLTRGRDELCYLLAPGHKEAAVEQLRARSRLEEDLVQVRKRRIAALVTVERNLNPQTIRAIAARDSLISRQEGLITRELDIVRATIDAAVRQFTSGQKVIRKDTSRAVQAAFDLTELPGHESVPENLTYQAALTLLEAYPKAKRLLQESKLLVLVRDQQSSPSIHDTTAQVRPAAESLACPGRKAKNCTRVFYREPVPRELLVFVAGGESDTSVMVLRTIERHRLISSADPVLNVAFSPNAFGTAKTAISFGARGNVTALEQNVDASLAKASSTIANALTSARQEFVAGIGGVKEAQASALAIQGARRTARIQELKDESALLDVQISLEGAAQTRDLVNQRKQVEATLALLQAQQSLASASIGADPTAELTVLRGELEKLKLELDIMKVRIELNRAEAESNTMPVAEAP